MKAKLALALAILGASSCQQAQAERAETSPLRTLPELSGFSASGTENTPIYVRRVYSRNAERIAVTLASFPMTAAEYRSWVQMSTATFPQAEIDVEAGEGNAFYECSGEQSSRCDLLIQLRCGAHLEIRGEGRVAQRTDADEVAARLPIRSLSTLCN